METMRYHDDAAPFLPDATGYPPEDKAWELIQHMGYKSLEFARNKTNGQRPHKPASKYWREVVAILEESYNPKY